MREIYARRQYNHVGIENTGPTHNGPDTLVVYKIHVPKLARQPKNGSVSPGMRRVEETFIDPLTDNVIKIIADVPTTRIPLTPTFAVRHGGGRIYGGGVSEESLRRAKRKAKRRPEVDQTISP